MDDIDLGNRLKRVLQDRRDLIQEVLMDGLLKDIEHYKSLQGELSALHLIESEIKAYFKESVR